MTVFQGYTPDQIRALSPVEFSVNNSIEHDDMAIAASVLNHGTFPNEFIDPDDGSEINIREDAKGLVKRIGDEARKIILDAINTHYTGKSELKYSPKILPNKRTEPVPKGKNFQVIKQKSHKFPLTRSMANTGWLQMMAKVSLITREEAAVALGMKIDTPEVKELYKAMRYAVHYWVSPSVLWDQKDHEKTQGLVWGKIKTEGKRPLLPKS